MKQSLEIKKNISLNERNDSDVAGILYNIGDCLKDMQQYDDALTYFNRGLSIYEALLSTGQNACDIADVRDCSKQFDKAILSAKL